MPQVVFDDEVGDVNPLGGLNVLVGMQVPNTPEAAVGELSPDLTQAIGQISIARDITTEQDQFYQANLVNTGSDSGTATPDVALTSRQGTVTVVLGQRADAGLVSAGNLQIQERAAVSAAVPATGGEPNRDPDAAGVDAGAAAQTVVNQALQTDEIQADETQAIQSQAVQSQAVNEFGVSAGILDVRAQTAQQTANALTNPKASGQPVPGESVLLRPEVEVGEIDSFVCESLPDSPEEVPTSPEDC